MDPALIVLIALGPMLALPALWCGICLLLSRIGGWHRLAGVYETQRPPQGRRHGWQQGWFGGVSYRGCLHIYVAPEGLYLTVMGLLRVGHPPLMIPWGAIHGIEPRRYLWRRMTRFQIGQPVLATVELPDGILEGRSKAEL
ncbi:MAG TPA: hypothetical protein VLI06_19045 [Solimonas sp.]|nr:hypothetical protein [Solimonas sp.]